MSNQGQDFQYAVENIDAKLRAVGAPTRKYDRDVEAPRVVVTFADGTRSTWAYDVTRDDAGNATAVDTYEV